jgi:hypothetical protein
MRVPHQAEQVSVEIVVRRASELDSRTTALIYSSWLDGYRDQAHLSMPSDAYYPWQRARIERILAMPSTVVALALDPQLLSLVRGYAVATLDAVHWAYTKATWRRDGAARACLSCLPERPRYYTHEAPRRRLECERYGLQFRRFR